MRGWLSSKSGLQHTNGSWPRPLVTRTRRRLRQRLLRNVDFDDVPALQTCSRVGLDLSVVASWFSVKRLIQTPFGRSSGDQGTTFTSTYTRAATILPVSVHDP